MPRALKLEVGRFPFAKRWEIHDLVTAVLQDMQPIDDTAEPLHAGEVAVYVHITLPPRESNGTVP